MKLKTKTVMDPTLAQTPPKTDEAMQKVLDALADLGGQPIETLTPEQARQQPTPADAVKKVMQQEGKSTAPDSSVMVKDIIIRGHIGYIPLHIYIPVGAGPFPVMIYYHGGGFVIADSTTYDETPRALAQGAKAIIVAVDYHKAPEHKFPAAPNDAYTAYLWVLQHIIEFNGDPSRIAVGGESAGANLAAVVSMMARDKATTLPLHQLLVYPVTDNDFNTPSYLTNAQAKPLNKIMMSWFLKHYMTPEDADNPYALPMKAASLKDLPDATVITAEIDPLRSEGQAYAERLKNDGVAVAYQDYTGVTHGDLCTNQQI